MKAVLTEISLFGSPGLIMILGGLLLYVLRTPWRGRMAPFLPLLALIDIWGLNPGDQLSFMALGHRFILLQVHSWSTIFAVAFALAAFGGALFAFRRDRGTEVPAAMIYGGSAIGLLYAGDFVTLLIFYEIMAIFSLFVIWASSMKGAQQAGMRYAWMHLLGGLFLTEGIALYLYVSGGDVSLVRFTVDWQTLNVATGMGLEKALNSAEYFMLQLSVWSILLGILVNVAAPPFSAWLPDAYPEASPSGAIFLSAFTTKSAVFLLLLLFPGTKLLIAIGILMVFYGIFMAMLENDLRRILSYSIINQVGFMVTAIGIGSKLALLGAAAHAFCHILYKALLLMSAGAVIEQTGKRKCTELGGLYHSMPFTTVCAIIGALAISAFPLTSGFVSKSMINDAAANAGLFWLWLALLAGSAGVFLHAGIKYPWFVFFQKDSGQRPRDPDWPLKLAMGLFSVLCILPGIWPGMVYHLLPELPDYVPNTAVHWMTQLQLLLFAGLAFFIMLPWLQRSDTVSLDVDWFYRKPGWQLAHYLNWLGEQLYQGTVWLGRLLVGFSERHIRRFHGISAKFARSVSSSITLTWVGTLLGVYLLIYYVWAV